MSPSSFRTKSAHIFWAIFWGAKIRPFSSDVKQEIENTQNDLAESLKNSLDAKDTGEKLLRLKKLIEDADTARLMPIEYWDDRNGGEKFLMTLLWGSLGLVFASVAAIVLLPEAVATVVVMPLMATGITFCFTSMIGKMIKTSREQSATEKAAASFYQYVKEKIKAPAHEAQQEILSTLTLDDLRQSPKSDEVIDAYPQLTHQFMKQSLKKPEVIDLNPSKNGMPKKPLAPQG